MTTIKTHSGMMILAAGLLIAGGAPVLGQTLLETFTYPNGPLEGHCPPQTPSGCWTLDAGPSGQINVAGNAGQILFNNNTATAFAQSFETWTVGALECPTDHKVTVTFMIKGNPNTVTSSGFTWSVQCWEPGGKELGRFYGTPTGATGRMAGQTTNASAPLSTTAFTELKIVFDMAGRKTYFYYTPSGGSELPVGSPNYINWNTLGVTVQPPQGTNIVQRVQIIDWNAASTYNGDMTIDDLKVIRCPGSCFMDIAPPASDYPRTSYAAVGGPVYPPTHAWTLSNTGEVAFNWTATTDAAWLSLLPASSGLTTGTSTDVTGTWTSGALGVGLYGGKVNFGTDCPSSTPRPVQLVVGSVPCFVDTFPYPDGNLYNLGGWVVSPASPTVFQVSGGTVQVLVDGGGGGTASATINTGGCRPCEDGKIIASVKVKGATANGNNAWALYFDDPNGRNLAEWFGTAAAVTPRIGGAGVGLPAATLTVGQYDTLEAEIDTLHHTTQFFHTPAGGSRTSLGTVSHGAEFTSPGPLATVGRITIQRVGRAVGDGATGNPTLDELQVLSCPGECLASVAPTRDQPAFTQLPWAALGGTTAAPPSRDYILYNDGLVTIPTYTIEEVTAAGAPTDYSWITLSKTTGGPVSAQASDAPVTVTFDPTSLTTAGPRIGYVRFTDTCNPARTYTRAVKLNIGDCLGEIFDNYANGPLVDAPGWEVDPGNTFGGGTSIGVTSPIAVNSGVLQILGDKLSPAAGQISVVAQHRSIDNCPVCAADGLIRVNLRIRGHSGGSALWEIHFTPNGGQELATWRGTASSATPSAQVDGDGTPITLTGGGVWDELEARINVHATELEGIPATSTAFYFNGQLSQTLSHGLAEVRVRKFRVVRIGNDTSGDADPMVELDKVTLSACGPVCGSPVFDANRDHQVDANDLQTLTKNGLIDCATGPSPDPSIFDALSFQCQCLDINKDRAIDMQEFAAFQRCVSAGTPDTPADPKCAN